MKTFFRAIIGFFKVIEEARQLEIDCKQKFKLL